MVYHWYFFSHYEKLLVIIDWIFTKKVLYHWYIISFYSLNFQNRNNEIPLIGYRFLVLIFANPVTFKTKICRLCWRNKDYIHPNSNTKTAAQVSYVTLKEKKQTKLLNPYISNSYRQQKSRRNLRLNALTLGESERTSQLFGPCKPSTLPPGFKAPNRRWVSKPRLICY